MTLTLQVADATTADLGDASFELLIVLYLHLPRTDMAGVLRRCQRAVGPGGTLLVLGHDRASAISASPVHRSFGVAASNRPNARGGSPSGRVLSSRRAKCRCNVRAVGAVPSGPAQARRIALTCVAVRAGTPLQRRPEVQHSRDGPGFARTS